MKNQNLSLLKGKKKVINKGHAEFISASSTQVVLPWKQQRQALKILNQVQDDGTYFNNNGFTLIELLVVVLIIAILAAVAVPQYNVAVAKARVTQLYTLGNAVRQAEERYFLENNQYTKNWTELDVNFEGTDDGSWLNNDAGWSLKLDRYIENSTWESVTARDSRLPSGFYLIFSFANAHAHAGKALCFTPKTSDLGNILCKNLAAENASRDAQGDAYWYYMK